MFCIYCGTNNPDDAVFCRSCGKRQPQQATDAIILPGPPLPEVPAGDGQSPVGNVPMVPGTPSASADSSGQSLKHNAANSAPSTSLPAAPTEAGPSRPLPPTHDAEGQGLSAVPKTYHQFKSQIPPHATPTIPPRFESPISPAHYSDDVDEHAAPGGLKLAGKLLQWHKIALISSFVVVVIVISAAAVIPKLAIYSQPTPQTAKTVITPPPTPDSTLCSGDTSGGPLSSGQIDKSHPFHQDDGHAAQGDQGGFSPISLCSHIAATSYAMNFHAMSPYILLYLYDSKHAKYEIDYNIYPDHISVITYPGFSLSNRISVGEGTYSNTGFHTYQIEFRRDSVRVLVDGATVLSGSAGFSDDGSGDVLQLQSHQITMDQFSVTRI